MRYPVILILILSMFLTGCMNSYHELETIAIVSALSIDKEGDDYVVSAQIINPDSVQSVRASQSPVYTYLGKGETLLQAIKQVKNYIPRYLFLSDLRFLVLSEEIARNEFRQMIDYFLRDSHIRSDFVLFLSKEHKATDILTQLTPISEVPADSLIQNMRNITGARYIINSRTLNTIIRDMEMKDIILPGVQIVGDKEKGQKDAGSQIVPPSRLNITNIAIFNGDKFVGWSNETENIGVSMLLDAGSEKSLSLKIPACDRKIGVVVKDPLVEIKGSITNGQPKIYIRIASKSYVGHTSCDISTVEISKEVEKEVEKNMKEIIEDTIHGIINKYNSDIFGFGHALESAHPREWNKLAHQQWLKNLDVHVEVNNKLEGTGQIFNPVHSTRK